MSTAGGGFSNIDAAAFVGRIKAGDEGAFGELYTVAHPALLRFAYQIVHSREAAEDAVQHVFVNLWLRRSDHDFAGSLRAYLYRAVRNRALDMLRHARLVAHAEVGMDLDAPYGMGAANAAADTVAEAGDEARRLAALIRTLPERQRTAVLLRWYDDLPIALVAETMGISRQAVEKLLRGAEAHLRAALGGQSGG